MHTSEWGADYSSLEVEVTAFFDKHIEEADKKVKKDLEDKKTAALEALKPKVENLDFWSKVKVASNKPEGIPSFGNDVSSDAQTPSYMAWGEPQAEEISTIPFPTSPKVYHFHPIAFVEQMKRLGTCFCDKDITVEAFEKIFGNGPWFSKSNMSDYSIYNTSTETFVQALNTAMNEHGITSCLQKAHFLAQCYHESDLFRTTVEYADGLDYDPASHREFHTNFEAFIIFLNKYTSGAAITKSTKVSQKPAEINESIKTYKKAYTDYEAATPTARLTDAIKALKEKHDDYLNFKAEKEKYDTIYANSYKRHKLKNNAAAKEKKEIVYKNWRSAYYRYNGCINNKNEEDGDGPKYRGRGIIQLTWKANYVKFKHITNIDCVTDPSLLASTITNAVNSAALYWKKVSPWGNLNKYADFDDILYVTIGVNGGFTHFYERYEKTQLLLDLFGSKNCSNFSMLNVGEYEFEKSHIGESGWAKHSKYGRKRRENAKKTLENAIEKYNKTSE